MFLFKMYHKNNRTHRKIIEDICEGCGKYCTLKEIISMFGLDDRALEQVKCVEMFKYEKSKQKGRDIGWEEAHKEWVSEGYAQKFAEVYKDGMKHHELYSLIMDREFVGK